MTPVGWTQVSLGEHCEVFSGYPFESSGFTDDPDDIALVKGENVGQAAQFVQSGAADAGVIALSLALSPAMRGKGRYWEVPLDAYPPIEQGGMVLPWAKDPDAARAFRTFLLSDEGKAVLKKYGFTDKPE